jgi:aryl-alcohol dehydrogenase-like predicted oxidoreductase
LQRPEQKLALGTVQIGLAYGVANQGGAVALPEVAAILEQARALGIDTLDTAVAYGESEEVLGRLGTEGFAIISKLPGLPPDCADPGAWVQEQLHASLARLGTAHLSGLLLHRPADLLGPKGVDLYRALLAARTSGLTAKIGISIYDPPELDALCARYDFDLVQAPFNILDTRIVASGWADRLQQRGTELHLRSAFLQGLLLMPTEKRPQRFDRFAPVWERWNAWLCANGLTPLQACLRAALACTQATKVVVGVDSQAHLVEIAAAAAHGPLSAMPAWPPFDPALFSPSAWNSL